MTTLNKFFLFGFLFTISIPFVTSNIIYDEDLGVYYPTNTPNIGWNGVAVSDENACTVGGWVAVVPGGCNYEADVAPFNHNTVAIDFVHGGGADPHYNYTNTSLKAEVLNLWYDTVGVNNQVGAGGLWVGERTATSGVNFCCGQGSSDACTTDSGVALGAGSWHNITFRVSDGGVVMLEIDAVNVTACTSNTLSEGLNSVSMVSQSANPRFSNFSFFNVSYTSFGDLNRITIYDEKTRQRILVNLSATLFNSTYEKIVRTDTGYLQPVNLPNGTYNIKLTGQVYPTRYYYNINISNESIYNFYLLNESDGHGVIFRVKDKSTDTGIQDVLVNTTLFMNESFKRVEQRYSDGLGNTQNWLQDDEYYNITFEKEGYVSRAIRILPDGNSYIILLDPGVNHSWANIWKDVSYNITPNPDINYLEPKDAQVFNISIYSKTGLLSYWGIKGPGNTSNITGKPYGGNTSITINTSNSTAFNIKVFFDATSFSPFEQNLTFGFFDSIKFNGSRNLWNLSKEYGKELTPLTKGILGIIGVIMAVGTVAEFGVFGIGLVVVGAIAFGFFAMVGWFNPIYVALALFVGLGLFFFGRGQYG